ncbi:Pyridoxamine 5'-phosphate oxidase [Pragia fontium]|uniref:pyridoxamine 5'-phosphate oxidase family protein n=1 Tax=Pragia fontium TaxID=82985 RepID=UPI000DFAAD1B|nr:pyridoxamine 5'-phosphate oxidase family protein [Pragia fontium]SUB82634.1 Pyridoxamine 5'-phosphate oxidase [Pragia fontium]
MDFLASFHSIMQQQTDMALASCVDNQPNVRIVNFYYHPDNRGVIYFSSFRNNPKTQEFVHNNRVAITTIPIGDTQHVRIHNATVHKSDLSLYDLQEGFVSKIPSYQEIIEQAGSELDLYEVRFEQAQVTIDHMTSGSVTVA